MTIKYRKCKTDNNQNKYANIKARVKQMNTAVVTSMSISGEGVSGVFNAFAILTFLRWNIINDTYHPFLFHYYVGVSVGSIIIGVVLNARFLYEEYGKEKSLEYIDATLSTFSFASMRSLFLEMGNDETFSPFKFNVITLISNLYNYGSICTRDVVKRFLQAENIPNFDNRENYFTSNAYYNWLDKELDNVFIVAYSAQQTKMVTFTGNTQRFSQSINFVSYEKLTPVNLIHAIICSSSTPLLHPVVNIDGTNYATDGASAEKNQMCYLQIMVNCSYFFSSNLLYTPLLVFFEIGDKLENKRTNFTIIHNKLNSQEWLEIPDKYPHRQVLLLQSIQNLLNYFPRIVYNATNNIPLLSLFRQQPFVKQFSNVNLNHIKNAEFQMLRNVIKTQQTVIDTIHFKQRIPSYDVCRKQFNDSNNCLRRSFKSYKAYKKAYSRYKTLTSNQPISTYLYESNPQELIELLDEKYENQYYEDTKGDYVECQKRYIMVEYDADRNCAYVRIANNKYVKDVKETFINIETLLENCDIRRYTKKEDVFTEDNTNGNYINVTSHSPKYKRKTLSLDICYFEVNLRDLFEKDSYRWIGLFTNDVIGNSEEQLAFMKNMGIVSGNLLFDMTIKQQSYSFNENVNDDSAAPNELKDVVYQAYKGFLGPVQS
jgi:hypothetical protein